MSARPLRVLLVAGTAAGGTRTHVLHLAEQLAAAGDWVTLVAPQTTLAGFSGGAGGFETVATGVGSIRDSLAVRTLLRRLASRHDITHAHGLRASAAVCAAGLRTPVVSTWHNANLGRGLPGRVHAGLERMVARRSALVLAVSPDLAERAGRAGARRVRQIQVPAPMLPAARRTRDVLRRELGIPSGRQVVLTVARLEPQKQLDVLVRSAAAWCDDGGPVVLIAGDGPDRAGLQRQIDGSAAPVALLGHRRDVADLLSLADVAVICSRWEGWPLSAQEALRAGLPLVASDLPGIRALAGDAAVFVAPGDPEALRSSVEGVLADEDLRRHLRVRAGAQASTWLTVEEANDFIREDYLDLISR